ncbi:response regulator [Litoreibacter roseus]|nr:response regulator transcription factor [Litoreibacter roseus]
MNCQTILVIEDEARIRALLRNVMEDEGYAVLEAENARQAIDIIKTSEVSLITLDIHLGPDDGLELAKDIQRISEAPIIMVTGKDDIIDRVVGLELGADDYITKPFHLREVLARIRTVLRRAEGRVPGYSEAPPDPMPDQADNSAQYSFDGLKAVPDRLELLDRTGAECDLTSGDFKLLSVFLARPKRVLSRDQLMDLTGGHEWSPLDRTIDNQIARLRKKIERDPSDPKLIKTVRGVGYTFTCDVRRVQSSASSVKSA